MASATKKKENQQGAHAPSNRSVRAADCRHGAATASPAPLFPTARTRTNVIPGCRALVEAAAPRRPQLTAAATPRHVVVPPPEGGRPPAVASAAAAMPRRKNQTMAGVADATVAFRRPPLSAYSDFHVRRCRLPPPPPPPTPIAQQPHGAATRHRQRCHHSCCDRERGGDGHDARRRYRCRCRNRPPVTGAQAGGGTRGRRQRPPRRRARRPLATQASRHAHIERTADHRCVRLQQAGASAVADLRHGGGGSQPPRCTAAAVTATCGRGAAVSPRGRTSRCPADTGSGTNASTRTGGTRPPPLRPSFPIHHPLRATDFPLAGNTASGGGVPRTRRRGRPLRQQPT